MGTGWGGQSGRYGGCGRGRGTEDKEDAGGTELEGAGGAAYTDDVCVAANTDGAVGAADEKSAGGPAGSGNGEAGNDGYKVRAGTEHLIPLGSAELGIFLDGSANPNFMKRFAGGQGRDAGYYLSY